ncbi:MAG: hypothetical protein RMJ59_00695 [Candidatus Nitrosocaldus sp.]|nr:hypothetical protein [Candidatus Nitrosocaldus sp.]
MKRALLLTLPLVAWLTILYTNALITLSIDTYASTVDDDSGVYEDGEQSSSSIIPESSRWVTDGYDDDGSDRWRFKVWKWREFLACESIALDMHGGDAYNYVRYRGSSVEMSLLTLPEMDYVHVAGISIGDVWTNGTDVYQPEPLSVAALEHLTLSIKVHEFKGAPLSPVVFPSWYALLTDLWFRVKNVTIEDGDGVEHYEEKVLGIDVYHRTMGGGLNIVMGLGDDYSRIEPCNKNFIYSINLSSYDGIHIDVLELLSRAQEEASKKGWHFSIEDVELVMVETVLESYWSYAYARIEPPSIIYKAGG